MKVKRVITLALAVTVFASSMVLTGCKKGKGSGDNATVTYWSEFSGVMETGAQSFADLPCMQELMKRTGVNIEFIHPSSTDYAEQFNLMIASGEYPDIIEYGIYSYPGGPQAAIDDGVIIPLNDVIKKYCPNLRKYLKENPEIDKAIKTDNGDYFCFPAIYNDDYLQVYGGMIARKDLLDQLGMENPETIDEWTEMLRGFKKLGVESPLISTPGNLFAIIQAYGIIQGNYIEDGKEKVELLTAPWAAPGTPVILEGADPSFQKPAKIDIDKFCKVEMKISDFSAQIAGVKFTADGKAITTTKSNNCEIC